MQFLKLKDNTHKQLHSDNFLYIRSNEPLCEAVRNLKDVYEMEGSLKFKELINDGYMNATIDPTNEFTYVLNDI